MQETQVRSPVQEDFTCCWATKSVHHNYWSGALSPQLQKPKSPRAHALQQKKPPQWETCTPQRRVAPCSPQLEKSTQHNEDPAQPKINKQKMSGILQIWEVLPMLGLRSRSAVTWGRWIQTLVGHSALLHLAPPHQFWVPGSHTCPHHSLSPSAWSLWVCVFFTPAAGKARDRDVVDYQDNSHRSVKKSVSLLPGLREADPG